MLQGRRRCRRRCGRRGRGSSSRGGGEQTYTALFFFLHIVVHKSVSFYMLLKTMMLRIRLPITPYDSIIISQTPMTNDHIIPRPNSTLRPYYDPQWFYYDSPMTLFVSETWWRRVPLVFPMWLSVPSLPLLLSILQPVSWSSFCIFSLGGNSFNFVRLSNSRQKLKRQFNKFLNSLTKLSQNTLTQFFQGSNPPPLVCDSTVLWRLHHVCDIVE